MGKRWVKTRIRIPAGPTVVLKKDKYGKIKSTIVRRKAYIRTQWVKDC